MEHDQPIVDWMEQAARGDRSAQMLLAYGALAAAEGDYKPRAIDPPVRELLIAAECFARFAAADNDPNALSTLAAVLMVRSNDLRPDCPERAEEYWADAADLMFTVAKLGDELAAGSLIAELTQRADRGCEDSAVFLNEVVSSLTPETVAAARNTTHTAQAIA